MRGLRDDASGRRRYLQHLEDKMRQEGAEAGRELPTGQSLHSTLWRGWMFGSDAFKEKLLALAGQTLGEGAKRRNYGAAPEVREHHLHRAEQLLASGLRVCALDPQALQELPCGDDRKALIALAIKRETTVPLDWLGSQLHMGTRSTVSRVTAEMARRLAKDKKLARQHHLIVKGAP